MNLPWTNRRQLLKGAATLGVAAALGPHVAFSADHKILRNRGEYRIQTLDPAFMWTNEEHMILVATMPRLIQYKAGDEWGWELADAKRVELVDQTHVEFELNDGMEWTDGYGEVTAEDVKYTFERVADPAVESWYADDWANLDHVEVTGKRSGVIVLSKPFAPLFASTLPYWQGTILCKKAVMELPEQKIELTMPAQCGPYKLVELLSETKALLVPNDDWYGSPKAAFDEIQLMVITEAKTAEIGYLAGELDIARISSSSVPTFEADMPPNTELVVGDALSYFWLGMMVEHPLYKDKRVRKAVQYAIDVQEVLDGGFQGVAKPSTGMIAPGLIGYREKRLVQGPDRDKSRQLLAEAGYPDGFDTKLVTGKAAEWVTAATVIQSQLAEVGIRVEVTPQETGEIWDISQSEDGWKDNQMFLWDYGIAPDPSWATVWFLPSQVGSWNWERWVSKEFEELHYAALEELDPAKRDVMYQRMIDIMEEDGAYVFLTHQPNAWIHNADLYVAFRPDRQGFNYRDTKPKA